MLIKEYLPNPAGKDTEGEYILLENDGQEAVNLSGWQLKDKKGKVFNLNGYTLPPNQELKLFYKTTKITLNNDGEIITLIGPNGEVVHELSYTGTAKEGFIVQNKFEVTEELREEFLESMASANLPGNANLVSGNLGSLVILVLALGIILAGVSVWILSKIEAEPRG